MGGQAEDGWLSRHVLARIGCRMAGDIGDEVEQELLAGARGPPQGAGRSV
jgi:hypothetical protein